MIETKWWPESKQTKEFFFVHEEDELGSRKKTLPNYWANEDWIILYIFVMLPRSCKQAMLLLILFSLGFISVEQTFLWSEARVIFMLEE